MKKFKKLAKIAIPGLLTLAFIFGSVAIGFSPIETNALGQHTCTAGQYQSVVTYYVPPTCETEGYTQETCTHCGYSEYIKIAAINHVGTGRTTVITLAPTCTTDGESVEICKRCGVAVTKNIISKTGHEDGVWKVDQEPTAEHDGQMSRYCTKCGQVLETKAFTAHKHTVGYTATLKQATCTEYGQKGTFCADCGACYTTADIAPTGHTDTDHSVWAITTPATCTHTGEKTAYCAICGTITGTQSVEALGHDEGVWYDYSAATCTKDGEKRCYCTRCGEIIDKETIFRLGHDDGVWSVSKAATCTAEGEKVCRCTRCNALINSEAIPATGHDTGVWKIDFEPNPNVLDSEGNMYGQMTRYCSVCNQALETKTFAKHTHTEGYREVIAEAGCKKDGKTGIFCAQCGALYQTETIPALGHKYADWYSNSNGTHSCICERCGDVKTEGCTYTETVTDPTCDTDGSTQYTCSVCGYSYTSGVTAAIGHHYGKWIDAGDTVSHYRVCTDESCGDIQYGMHEWTDWETEDGRTFWQQFTEDETVTRTCAFCGAKESQIVPNSSLLAEYTLPVLTWPINVIRKALYAVTLDWLFPWLNIQY